MKRYIIGCREKRRSVRPLLRGQVCQCDLHNQTLEVENRFEMHCYICTKPISIIDLHESYSHFELLIHGRVQSLSTLELGTQSTVKGEAENGDVSNFVACAPQLFSLKLWQRYRLTRSNFGLLTFFLTCVNALSPWPCLLALLLWARQ